MSANIDTFFEKDEQTGDGKPRKRKLWILTIFGSILFINSISSVTLLIHTVSLQTSNYHLLVKLEKYVSHLALPNLNPTTLSETTENEITTILYSASTWRTSSFTQPETQSTVFSPESSPTTTPSTGITETATELSSSETTTSIKPTSSDTTVEITPSEATTEVFSSPTSISSPNPTISSDTTTDIPYQSTNIREESTTTAIFFTEKTSESILSTQSESSDLTSTFEMSSTETIITSEETEETSTDSHDTSTMTSTFTTSEAPPNETKETQLTTTITSGPSTTTKIPQKTRPYLLLRKLHQRPIVVNCTRVCSNPNVIKANMSVQIDLAGNKEYFQSYKISLTSSPVREKTSYFAIRELYPLKLDEAEEPDDLSQERPYCKNPLDGVPLNCGN